MLKMKTLHIGNIMKGLVYFLNSRIGYLDFRFIQKLQRHLIRKKLK